ncbi:4-hydroxy-tetrahydrodipicolinate synthase [Pleionea sediminis]|uniref:4-hydroxy-tetrahydrodipicolinate synthase n=1 Tax=Pleionea sediminis TaxID=2569479 RepID=UPI001186F351|nr:4-hydroxy-tetrahydrodipicolinate synthase [Pleionea sediminis]
MLRGSIVAIVTPFTQAGKVDFAAYRDLVDWHKQSGTHGVVVAGTTGESASLTDAEIHRLVEITLEFSDDSFQVLVGNGANSTQATLQNTQALNGFAVDGFLTVCPYYVKPSQKGLVEHFNAVADIAQHPIYLYNVPARTACDLTNESVFQLAQHQNIIGLKDATGDLERAKELITHKGSQFSLLSGDDPTSQSFMEMGGEGVISVTANIVPQQMALRCNHTLAGEIEKARAVDASVAALHELLFVEANPIPVKWALAAMKKIEHSLRLPLTSLEVGQEALKRELVRLALAK